ncbi:MAG: hydrogenase maturation protease [Planctomycetota bacterium]|jgi:hydrogenase maturation protease
MSADARSSTSLILGLGNADGGDDGIGRAAVQHLVRRGLPAQTVSADPATLLAAWQDAARVVVIDAARGLTPIGSIRRFDAISEPLPASAGSTSSHGLGLAEAIELARALSRLPPSLVVYAVAADPDQRGPALSAPVAAALPGLVEQVAAECSGCTEAP